ncbi:hypothetical protein L6164_012854 [Bauhinia variegata]|uniref:Uncharacterized protein n=1 Tax=Bauhinia variegata TaxID=167791 RepID=A0ACB9PAU4_BAUVA|nr:hypothetical protein L6164_012854 [Bauhinia variegata]
MEEPFFDLVEFLKKPSITETLVDILLCSVPIWLAVMIGLVIGWSWRPRWTGLVFLGVRSKFRFQWTAPPGFGAGRLWFAFTAFSAFSICRTIWANFKGRGKAKAVLPSESENVAVAMSKLVEGSSDTSGSKLKAEEIEKDMVTQNDLEHLLHLLEEKDGEMDWQNFMEKSIPNMSYQAWRHEPGIAPTIYRSRTVFEDATPELVRDFFWDDEFRPKWDTMLAYRNLLEECSETGMTIVHWIKKFPFFCSDREYIIARRIWEAGNTYYCVTKGVPYQSMPKRDKPRRVELYFSSWLIKPVESHKGDGQLSACEVTLLHYEDMGIPKDVAKLGVRHGMWGAVKKLHSGMRAYQNARKSEAASAMIMTKIPSHKDLDSLESSFTQEEKGQDVNQRRQNAHGVDWKWVALGGTVALVLGLHGGAIGKAVLLGAGHRIARR